MARNRRRGIGDIISTVVFFGMSAWLSLEALALMGTVSHLQIYGLFAASIMCLLGGLRFVVVEILNAVRAAINR